MDRRESQSRSATVRMPSVGTAAGPPAVQDHQPEVPAGEARDPRFARRRSPRAAPRPTRRVRRRRATVRRVDPWSVLKLSLVFYVCALLIVMLGLAVFWAVVNRLGVITTIEDLASSLNILLQFNGANIARAMVLIGLLNVVLWSGINVFLAFLYNLVADLIGGLEVTLTEDE